MPTLGDYVSITDEIRRYLPEEVQNLPADKRLLVVGVNREDTHYILGDFDNPTWRAFVPIEVVDTAASMFNDRWRKLLFDNPSLPEDF